MNEQITEIIKKLSEKLGVASEGLWRALLKQAPLSAATELVLIVIVFIAFRKWFKSIVKRESDELTPVAWLVWGVLFGFAFICFGCNLDRTLAGFFNPEYWALKEILTSVK